MEKKLMIWKTKGMNRDLSVSAFNPEFAYENMNLRLTTNEGNTSLSWVNERGTKKLTLNVTEYMVSENNLTESPVTKLSGTPIGTAILNHKLIVFTHADVDNNPCDRIYVLQMDDSNEDTVTGVELAKGDFGFRINNPIETLVSYEANHIQKVYWVDGLNQPRIINIADSSSTLKWHTQTDCFNFIPSLDTIPNVSITKNTSGGGLFAPGVIQYCFTYVNKYGQQTNIFYTSPLHYLTLSDRGAKPDEKVTSSFTISLTSCDTDFDYVRVYSIQRTSINDTPFVRLVADLDIDSSTIRFTDDGTIGASMDPTELLYVGGKEIVASTIAEKDGTLFMGNIQEKGINVSSIQSYINKHTPKINFYTGDVYKVLQLEHTDGIYTHTNFLKNHTSADITTFKGGDTYRFGFQLQTKTGEWTEPIFIKDETNDKYPDIDVHSDTINLSYATTSIPVEGSTGISNTQFIKARPLIVYPTIANRNVLCQGVLNPTVFNARDRIDKSPFAQASWFFRPYVIGNDSSSGQAESITSSWSNVGDYPKTFNASTIADDMRSIKDIQLNHGYFKNNGLINNGYVLMATFPSDDVKNEVLKRGSLRTHEYIQQTNTTGRSTAGHVNNYYPFKGAICIDGLTYIFIKDSEWLKPTELNNGYNSDSELNEATEVEYIEGLLNVYTNSTIVEIYSELLVNNNHEFYYVQPNSGAPSLYKFGFFCNRQWYIIETLAVANASSTYTPLYYNNGTSGNALRFTHFDSLYSEDDLYVNRSRQIINPGRQIEIQGSVNVYSSPTDSTPTEVKEKLNKKSNTQFLIDQSIVTLNSPDIDFDTEVQTYGTDNLKLRIIGAIPITANASSHSITTSSNMLEAGYHKTYPESIEGITDLIKDIKYGKNNFGIGETDYNVYYPNMSINAGLRLVSGYLWNDVLLEEDDHEDNEEKIQTSSRTYNYLVFPWQRNGSLNNDWRTKDKASSLLQTKKISNLLFSQNTEYFTAVNYNNICTQIHLTENDYIINYRLSKQGTNTSEINYYPNIDKVLYNESGYKVLLDSGTGTELKELTTPISMKYKSTSHAVIALKANYSSEITSNSVPILPYCRSGSTDYGQYDFNATNNNTSISTFWGDTLSNPNQSCINVNSLFLENSTHQPYSLLWLGELYKKGSDFDDYKNCKWVVGGNEVSVPPSGNLTLTWTRGDTYYQRYDCLKTYPFTKEDSNQIVEILSFMCETHVNLDGRYDRNRGQIDNTNMSPQNFNLLNPVYSQRDNFFTYQKASDEEDTLSYPNQIIYSKTKLGGADVDLWTNVTLANALEMDGSKGKVTALRRLNDQLICFQESGISQIMYNENMQMSTAQGVPIEIANSGKVTGKRYITDTIGCQNKWSITTTPYGIYFIDNNDKGIYLFNGQLNNLSLAKGFNTWSKQNIPASTVDWTPVAVGDDTVFQNITSYYDKANQDVMFTDGNISLAYSEKLQAFTSFYNYGNEPYLVNLDDIGLWIHPSDDGADIYQHQAGDYSNIFGNVYPYWTTLVGNADFQRDKTFTNLEFRACTTGEGTVDNNKFTPYLPFDSLEAWNEHQHGIAALSYKNGSGAMQHHLSDNTASLNRKFRIWRCDIPRNNALLDNERQSGVEYHYSTDEALGISRYFKKPLDRMRNPWVYLKLTKSEPNNVIINLVAALNNNATLFSYSDVTDGAISLHIKGDGTTSNTIYISSANGSGIPSLQNRIEATIPYTLSQSEFNEVLSWQSEKLHILVNGSTDSNNIIIEKTIENIPKTEIHDITMTYFM